MKYFCSGPILKKCSYDGVYQYMQNSEKIMLNVIIQL